MPLNLISLKGYFHTTFQNLHGKDWIKKIPKEDRDAFMSLIFLASDYGRLGGKKRAQTATRDKRGRFVKSSEKE